MSARQQRIPYDEPCSSCFSLLASETRLQDFFLLSAKYESGAIMEFDTLDDLRGFDNSYVSYVDSKVFRNIKSVLKCNDGNIKDIQT